MATNLNVGDSYTITPGSAGTDAATKGVPPWMEWSAGTASGTAELPSGFRRITLAGLTAGQAATIQDKSVDIAPVTLPTDSTSPWRCAIFAPNGAYIVMNGLTGVPTIGTPRVRLTRSAPSRAQISLAIGEGTDNVLGATFKRWSDGTARPIARGMEITVEYRDEDSRTLVPVFRGRIFQIESGEAVTITAYDRLMDLYQTTGQYLSHAGQTQGATSQSRTEAGDNWVYEMGESIGIITGIDAINRLDINALSALSTNRENTSDIIIHPLPSAGGITPVAGDIISRIQTKLSAYVLGVTRGSSQAGWAVITVGIQATVYIFERQGATFVQRATGSGTAGVGASARLTQISSPFDGENNGQVLDITLNNPVTIGDPANIYLGIKLTAGVTKAENVSSINRVSWGADRSTDRPTVSGTYYRSADGSSWNEYTESAKTELGAVFTHQGASLSPSLATISNTQISIAKASIPEGPTATYLTTEEKGVGILVDYYVVNKAPLADIIRELIERAGLNPSIGSANLGLVTLYTLATSDYLTAVHEIIDARGYGIKDTIIDAGTIALLPEHTTAETPVLSITTDPAAAGQKIILAHQLTAHWAAEKATVAYIAENATASGLPLALQTDDGQTDGSLIEALQAPLSIINVDNTLGSHDMMAHRAAGAIRKLHTNTIEGTVTLAGYRPGIWDLMGSGIGGLPIELNVPEYRAQGVVIPTEVELADGVTIAKLDNIRTQDRSGLAQSMGLVEGSISNDASQLPKTVYIFGKADGANQLGGTFQGLTAITLVREDGTTLRQASGTYLRSISDGAGYLHLLAVLPEAAGSYTSTSPIIMAIGEITTGEGSQHISAAIEPHYILDNQNIHIDIRLRNQ